MKNNDLPPVTKEQAIKMYQDADASGKKLLEQLYPGFDFLPDEKKYPTTWEGICEAYLKLPNRETDKPHELPYPESTNPLEVYLNGCKMVAVTNWLINGGRCVDMNDGKAKFWLWWDYSSGFRFEGTYADWTDSDTFVGPRLCFYSKDKENILKWLKSLTLIYEQMFCQPNIVDVYMHKA